MRVVIDLERDIIIIPDNFFLKVKADNERLAKYGAKPVSAVQRIKNSYNKAIADTDNRLITQSNAKIERVKKKADPTSGSGTSDKKDEKKTDETKKDAPKEGEKK